MKRLLLLLILLGLCLALALVWLRPVPPHPALPPLSGQVERIVVEKAARRLTLWCRGVLPSGQGEVRGKAW